MLEYRIIQKIGKKLELLLVSLFVFMAWNLSYGDGVRFSAEVDSSDISIHDAIALKLTVQLESDLQVEEPQFSAPDFEKSGEYHSVSVNSVYDSSSGRLSSVKTQQTTQMLKPTRAGDLKITDIRLNTGGKFLKAPEILIHVSKGAGGSPQRGAQSQRRQRVSGLNAVIRAEMKPSRTYFKGQQLVVSYYLYRQMRIFNLEIHKYPALGGFLREDLRVPVMGQRLESEPVVLNGEAYDRSLLAEYAVYPLQEGQLVIDPMALKFNFYPNSSTDLDEEDRFFGFFQQMVPKVWSGQSDPIQLQVSSLPEGGRPQSFSGGIGDFTVTAAVDKVEVHAHDALTLTVRVAGYGNVATVQVPHVNFPNQVELYDSKGKTQVGRKGASEKVFELLFIPRSSGKILLPALEFGFFNPETQQYYVKSTEPFSIQVLDPVHGAPSSASNSLGKQLPPRSSFDQEKSGEISDGDKILGLKPPSDILKTSKESRPLWQFLYLGSFFSLLVFWGWVILDWLRKRIGRGKRIGGQRGSQISSLADLKGGSWLEVTQSYERLTEEILNVVEKTYPVGVRSLSHLQLEDLLVEQKGLSKAIWDRIVLLLEFSDRVRFAGSDRSNSEEGARAELSQWILECENLISLINKGVN